MAASAASAPLLPEPAAGAIGRLLDRVDGEHAERGRDTGRGVHRCDAIGRAAGDVVEVRRVAPDHGTETDDRVDVAELCELSRRDRNLERAGHPHDVDVAVRDTALAKCCYRAVQQARGDDVVEARDHDADPHAGRVEAAGVHDARPSMGAPAEPDSAS